MYQSLEKAMVMAASIVIARPAFKAHPRY